jgi:hypothetical protein
MPTYSAELVSSISSLSYTVNIRNIKALICETLYVILFHIFHVHCFYLSWFGDPLTL